MDWKWRRLEKDRRWTDGGLEVDSMDEMGTGGGLYEDPWGSVRYRAKTQFTVRSFKRFWTDCGGEY